MEKIKINNQIVLMRKYVKQAKVRVINKLTKEVKLLQERKGNEVQVAKAKRKAERFLEEISLMKKVKPDYISKLALSKANNWSDVLKQKTSKLNDRCIAALANYKAVQDEVEKFYSSNPTIVPKIPDLIKEWEEKSKLMKGFPKKGKKIPEIKKKRMEMSMKKMNSKDKFSTASSVLDQQIGEKTDILPQNQKSFSNDEVDTEENNTSSEESQDDENPPVFENHDHKKHKNISKKRLTRLNSDDQKNEISDRESSESKISDENSVKEESDEPCSDDESSTVPPPKKLTHDSDKSEDSDSMSEEISHVENKVIQLESRNKTFTPIKNNCSDFQEKKNKKQQVSDNQNAYGSPVKSSCIQTSDLFLKKKSTGKNLKAIALLNLDELEDLDEIPLDKSAEDDSEISEKEEEDTKMHSEKLNDPFFLGSGEVGNANKNERERDMSFSKEGSFPNNFNKRFQNSSSHSAFSRNQSSRFNNSKNRPFKRDQFQSEYPNDRFRPKGRHGFRRDAIPSSNRRERRNQMFGRSKTPQEKQSDKQYGRYKSRDSFRKENAAGIKGNDAGGKSLHPSWEAKKKLKEMAQTGFQGKRIVFSE